MSHSLTKPHEQLRPYDAYKDLPKGLQLETIMAIITEQRGRGTTIVNQKRKVGRNELCTCGCGLKSKQCSTAWWKII